MKREVYKLSYESLADLAYVKMYLEEIRVFNYKDLSSNRVTLDSHNFHIDRALELIKVVLLRLNEVNNEK